jgi:hypothetical protein
LNSAELIEPADAKDAVARGGYVPLPRVLRWFCAGSAATLVLTVLVAWLEFHAGWLKGRWDPLQYPLFTDLLEYVPTFRLVHTGEFFHPAYSAVAYPPFGAAVFGAIYMGGHPVVVYLVVAALALGYAVWAVRGALVRRGIRPMTAVLFPLTLVLASFPLWRLVPQGNIELFLWMFVVAGIWAYLRGHDEAAAVLWALAAAMKLYPIIFLALFVPRWKWRALAAGVATFVAATLLSLAYLGPSIAVAARGSLGNVFGYQGVRVQEWTIRELAGNHSFFTLVKFVAIVAGASTEALTKPYYLCGAVVFAVVFFGRVRKLPVANQLLFVSLFMVMLPPVSYFHTLVHLYAPWLLMAFVAIRAAQDRVRVPGLGAVMMLMLPLFSSFTLYTFPTLMIYAGLIQAALLGVLLVLAAVVPFEERSTVGVS